MAKYINADNLKTILEERRDTAKRIYGDLGGAVSGCIKLLDQQPAADVEPVTRCKDCKHRPSIKTNESGGRGVLVFPGDDENPCPCQNLDDDWYSYNPDDDFFCAYGKKKDRAG